jgi:mannosyltransferase
VTAVTASTIRKESPFLSRYWAQVVLVLILLIGFGLRIHALERQSMWTDEGLSLYRSGLPLQEVVANRIVIDGLETRDTNPPLYFILLQLWRGVSGNSITAMRLIGAATGFLAVPLVYLLAGLVYDRKVALVAALLMAISPLHVWHSQVMRNYGLLVTLNLFSVYGVMRFALAGARKPQWRWLLLWAVASLLGIYTHYFSLFVFAYGLLVLAVVVWQRWGLRQLLGRPRFWIGAVIILLLSIPAFMIALDRFQAGPQIDFYRFPLSDVLSHVLSAFSVGVIQVLVHPWWRVLPALILFILGIWLGLRRRRAGTLLLLGYQIVPLGLLFLVSVVNPLYNGSRHLLIGLPPFLVLVANGMADASPLWGGQSPAWLRRATRALRVLLGVILILIQLSWLHAQFTDPALLRDDIRGAAAYLNEVAEEQDLIVLHDTIIGFVCDYYYGGAAPWRAIPRYGELDVAAAEDALAEAGKQAARVWFLTEPTPRTGFPRKALSDWAENNWPRFLEKRFPHLLLPVGLEGYAPDPTLPTLPEEVTPIGVQFGETLRLEGLEMPQAVGPRAPWLFTWYWSVLANAEIPYELSIRWLDEDGRLWSQTDDLLWSAYPPSRWPEGEIVRFDHAVNTPPGLPPGNYQLWLRLLDKDSRELLTEDGRNEVYLGDMTVTAASQELAPRSSFSTQSASLGPVELLGYQLPSGTIKPGHEIPITFLWRVREEAGTDYQLRIQLIDPAGEAVAEHIGDPTRSNFPVTAWQKGDIFQGKGSVAVPASATAEAYAVNVAFVNPATGETVGRSVTLDDALRVSPWPLETELPAVDVPVAATFGEPPFTSLYGYDLAADAVPAGGVLDLTLVWQALDNVSESMMSFIHIEDAAGNIVAQQDSVPAQGIRPTSSWRKDEVIIDQHLIPIGPEVAADTYNIWLGLYIPETGERAAVTQDGQPQPDGRLLLGTIEIIPAGNE